MNDRKSPPIDSDAVDAYLAMDAGEVRENAAGADTHSDVRSAGVFARCDAALALAPKLSDRPEIAWAFEEAAALARTRPPTASQSPPAWYARPALAWSVAAVAVVGWLSFAVGSFGTRTEDPARSAADAVQAGTAPIVYTPVIVPTGIESTLADIDPVAWQSDTVAVDNRLVAVLPFDAAAGAEAVDIAELTTTANRIYGRLMRQLAAISGLYVVDPGVAAAYAQSDLPSSQIAAYLGVRGVLEGTLESNGDAFELRLRFTDAALEDGSFERSIEGSSTEFATIENDITRILIGALRVSRAPPNDTTL